MSSSSIIDFVPSPTIVHDETSNQSIEIPDPPVLSVTQISTSDNPSVSSPSDDEVNEKEEEEAAAEALPRNMTFDWLDEQMRAGVDLHQLLRRVLPGLRNDLPPSALFEILMDLFLPVRERQPLEQYQTLDDAVELIRRSKNILVLTGAGISVSCGSKIDRCLCNPQMILVFSCSSWFSFSQRHLCSFTWWISSITEPAVDVWHWIFCPRSSSLLSFCQRDLARAIPTLVSSLLHRRARTPWATLA